MEKTNKQLLNIATQELVKYSGQTFSETKEAMNYILEMLMRVAEKSYKQCKQDILEKL